MPAQNILALLLLLAIAVWFVVRARAVSNITPAQPEPRISEHDRCSVTHPQRCHERAATEIHGWRLCAGHLLERVCNVMDCDQAARHTVTRHGHALRVCTDCHDEGHALGLWDAEVSA